MKDSPFRYAGFRWLVVARVLSSGGNWMKTVAAGWLVYQLTGDPIQVGILAAVSKGPSLVAAPFGGWLSDRMGRRRLLVVLSVAELVPMAVLTFLTVDGIVTTLEVYVLTFLGALPHSLRGPVLAVLSPELVPAALARRAISASSSAYNLARLAGPAIGGGLVTTVGVAAAFAVNTVALAAILVAILLIPAAQVRTTAAKGGTRGGLRAGVAATWRSLLLRTMLASAVTFFVFVGPLEQVMPVVAADHGDGAEFIGLLLAGIALGGLIGNPIAARLQARQVNEVRVLGGALIASGLLLVVLAVSRNLWLDLAVVTLIGAAWEIIWLVQNTAIHYRSPEGISGEVMGLLYMIVSVSVALGSVVTGWAFATIGVEASLLASAALLIVLGSIPAVTGHRILARQ